MKRVLLILFFVPILYSCNNNKNYGKLFKIEHSEWSSTLSKSVIYKSDDTTSLRNISLMISTTPYFYNDELAFELTIISPNGASLKDTVIVKNVNFDFSKVKKTISKLHSTKTDIIKDVKFHDIGVYIFKTRPITDILGIESFGFYIEQQ